LIDNLAAETCGMATLFEHPPALRHLTFVHDSQPYRTGGVPHALSDSQRNREVHVWQCKCTAWFSQAFPGLVVSALFRSWYSSRGVGVAAFLKLRGRWPRLFPPPVPCRASLGMCFGTTALPKPNKVNKGVRGRETCRV